MKIPPFVLLLQVVTACVPTVAHGPRVEPGFSAGGSGALPLYGPRYGDALSPYAIGPLGADFGYGWRGDDDSPALRVGTEFMIARLDPDVYVQLPRSALLGMDGGLGVAATVALPPKSWMPYAQLGVTEADGSGFYTTQGLLRQGSTSGTGRTVLHDDGCVSTLGYQAARDGPIVRLFVTGVFGRRFGAECGNGGIDCRGLTRPWTVFVGASYELVAKRWPRHPASAMVDRMSVPGRP